MQMKFQSEKKNLKSSRENFGQPVKFGKQKYQFKIFYTCEKKIAQQKGVFRGDFGFTKKTLQDNCCTHTNLQSSKIHLHTTMYCKIITGVLSLFPSKIIWNFS